MSKKKLYSDVMAGKSLRKLEAWTARTRKAIQAAGGKPATEAVALVDCYDCFRADTIGLRMYIWKQTTPDAAPSKGEDFLGRDAADQRAMLAQLKALDALSKALALRLAIRGIEIPDEAK